MSDITPPADTPIGVAEASPNDGSIGRTSWIPRTSELHYPAPETHVGGAIRSIPLDAAPLPPGPLVTPDGQAIILTLGLEEAGVVERLVVVSPAGSVVSIPLPSHVELLAVAPGAVLLSRSSELVAMSVPTGESLWRSGDSGGLSPAPALHRGIAYSFRNGSLSATSLEAGQLLWSVDVDSPVAEVAVGEGVLVVGDKGGLVGFDPADGRRRWEFLKSSIEIADGLAIDAAFGEPTVDHGHIYVTVGNSLLALDGVSGEVAWHVEENEPPRFGVAVDAVNVYYQRGVGDSMLVARRRTTGLIVWEQDLNGGSLISAPVTASGRVLSLTVIPTDTELIYDTELVAFDESGTIEGEVRLTGSGSWQVGTGGGYLAVAGSVGRDPAVAGPWELTIIEPVP